VSKRARSVVLGVLAGALGLAVSYGVGRAEGAAKVSATEQKAEAKQADLTKNTSTLKQELFARDVRIAKLEARRRVHQAELALERDNFGTARSHLEEAHRLLKGLAPSPGSELEELTLALASFELGVAKDSSTQRKALKQLAASLDDLLG
jgi:hypothetical protein